MSLTIIAIGQNELNISKEVLGDIVRSNLMAINAKRLIVDYSEGWNSLVLDEARKIGLPYMGAIPFENPELKNSRIYNAAISNIVFNQSKKEFLANPFPYLKWVDAYVGEVFAYVDMEKHSFNRTILSFLKEKTIRNLYKSYRG